MKNLFLLLVLLTLTTASWAGNKAAVVKLIKGEAYAVNGDKKVKLNVNDWIETGSVLQTSAKSFVKLVFIDKSQMNVGPQSEIKIEKFHTKDAGVIDLVKGKIRAQVTKDYLQIQGKDRSKLFIKTNNAVMGIRGTDFMISTNGKNTAAILFEGEVVFNRLNDKNLNDSAKLDELVDRGVRLYPGEFSAVGESGAPTIPALLSVGQRDRLEKNANFNSDAKSTQVKITKSIVPPGLKGDVVSSKPKLNDQQKAANGRASDNPESYFKDGQIKPANGSMVHVDSATIIAPGADAVLDPNTNTYISSDKTGSINDDGNFFPPKGVVVDGNGVLGTVNEKGVVTAFPNQSPIVSIPSPFSGPQLDPLVDIVNAAKPDANQNPDPVANTTTGGVSGGTVGGTTGGTVGGTTGGTVGGTSGGTDGGTTGGTNGGVIGDVIETTAGVGSGASEGINRLLRR